MTRPGSEMAVRGARRSAWLLGWFVFAASLVVGRPASAGEGLFHRLPRYDLQQTRSVQAAARLDSPPVVRWRYFAGGRPLAALAVDVDGDQHDDLLTVESGAVIARRLTGQVIWNSGPIGATGFLGRPRLADGSLGIGVRAQRGLRVLRTADGKELFSSPPQRSLLPQLLAFADVDGDGVDEAITADGGGYSVAVKGVAYVYRVADGSLLAQTPDTFPDGAPAGGQVMTPVDCDGDGDAEIFVGHQDAEGVGTVFAYDGQTGAVTASSKPGVGRTCDVATAVPSPQGGAPVVICGANFGASTGSNAYVGFAAFRQVDGAFTLLWEDKLDHTAAEQQTNGQLGDLDGDGALEILTARRRGGIWATEAFDALTGAKLPGGAAPFRQSLGADGVVLLGDANGSAGGSTKATLIARWSRTKGMVAAWSMQGGSVLPLGADASGQHNLVQLLDDDGDGRVDRLQTSVLGADLQPKVTATRPFAGDPVVIAVAQGSAEGARLLVNEEDGSLWSLRHDLVPLAGAEAGPATRIGATPQVQLRSAPLQVDGGDFRVLVGARARLLALDVAQAGPSTPPEVKEVARVLGGQVDPLAADIDGDGTRELVIRYTDAAGLARVDAYESDGTLRWTYVHADAVCRWPNGEGVWTALDVDGDSDEDILPTWRYAGPDAPVGRRVPLDGATGKPLWDAEAACRSGQAETASIDPTVPGEGVVLDYGGRRRCDLKTGAVLGNASTNAPRYGYAIFAALDGLPGLDGLMVGGTHGIGAFGADLKQLWVEQNKLHQVMDAALVPTAGGPALLVARSGTDWRLVDGATGKEIWAARYADGKRHEVVEGGPGAVVGLPTVVTALFSDGEPGALFTTDEGRLYAIATKDGEVRWSVAAGGALGALSVADVDDDGEVEIVLAMPDGNIACLDRDVLPRPEWVREYDGKGAIDLDPTDVDEQPSGEAIFAYWAAVPGAAGYRGRVLDDAGNPITAFVDFGGQRAGLFDGLALIVGARYQIEVVAYGQGATGVESLPTRSNGVRVVDPDPPTILSLGCTPAGATIGAPLLCTLQAEDGTRLASLDIAAIEPGTGTVLASATRLTTARIDAVDLVVPTAALSPGDLRLRGVVVDAAGHDTTHLLPLLVCPADAPFVTGVGGGHCGPITPDVDNGLLGDEQADGCGCDARRPAPFRPGALVVLGIALSLVLLRRRGVAWLRGK